MSILLVVQGNHGKSSSNAVGTLLTLITRIYSVHYFPIFFDKLISLAQRLAGPSVQSESKIRCNFARAIKRHSSPFECNAQAKLLSDPETKLSATATAHIHTHSKITSLLLSRNIIS